jgi:hypothetical protein
VPGLSPAEEKEPVPCKGPLVNSSIFGLTAALKNKRHTNSETGKFCSLVFFLLEMVFPRLPKARMASTCVSNFEGRV